MKNALIIGATAPETTADMDGSNASTTLGGCSAATADALMHGGVLRPTLLTLIQRDDLGKATIRLLERSGLLYRAVDYPIPTPHHIIRRDENGFVFPDDNRFPIIPHSAMVAPISQTAAEYDYVVADCNLDTDTIGELARNTQKFIMNGTNVETCQRLLSSNPWPKAAITINRQESATLIDTTKVRGEQQLREVLCTDQLLVTKDRDGWILYTPNGHIVGPPTSAHGHQNYTGAGNAALAGLIQTMCQGQIDPTNNITQLITYRLRANTPPNMLLGD